MSARRYAAAEAGVKSRPGQRAPLHYTREHVIEMPMMLIANIDAAAGVVPTTSRTPRRHLRIDRR